MIFPRVLKLYSSHKSFKNLLWAILTAVVIIIIGVIGYGRLLNLTPLDSMYFTVVTLGSVGYGDIYPNTPEAKAFTVLFIIVGVSVFIYAFSVINSMLFEGTISEVFKMEDVKENISKLKGHSILCGYGDVGEILAQEIKPVVVVDKNEGKVENLISSGTLAVQGDSTRPETLVKAGVGKAKSIVIALDKDPDVLFTILTAKELNSGIRVYARANRRESVGKMRHVGADYVVCLPELGGVQLMEALRKDGRG